MVFGFVRKEVASLHAGTAGFEGNLHPAAEFALQSCPSSSHSSVTTTTPINDNKYWQWDRFPFLWFLGCLPWQPQWTSSMLNYKPSLAKQPVPLWISSPRWWWYDLQQFHFVNELGGIPLSTSLSLKYVSASAGMEPVTSNIDWMQFNP
jgi:hypothetical protein